MGMGATVKQRVLATFAAVLGLLTIVASISAFDSRQATAAPGINATINFQGRLLNAQGAVAPDGNYNVQFKIYRDGDGQSANNATGSPAGALLWTETRLNSAGNGVQVKNGYLSVELGSVTPFGTSVDWNQDKLWLSLNVGNTNLVCASFATCSPDGEMLPMKRLSSTPYSLNSQRLNGLQSTDFLQLARGVQTDASTNTSSVFINKTGTGNLIQLQSSGTDAFVVDNAGNLTLGSAASKTISVAQAASGQVGRSLTLVGGAGSNVGTGTAGGALVLQGGNAAGTGNNNGGDITISGGTGTGTGTKGLVNLSASSFITSTNPTCTVSCTIDQSRIDNFGAVIVNASNPDLTITLPDPTNTAATGRIVYITTASGSQNYGLSANTGTDTIEIAMRQNTTATMIWNGTDWTPGGASNATTLQAVYVNGTNPSTTPEIKLDSIRGTIDIQDANTTIGSDILNLRASSTTGLGTVLFGVSNTGRVTIQGTTDNESAFRVLDASSNYLFNLNSSNGYVISNSIRTPGNEITNPNFEAGGNVTGGEEGWFGPGQATILNDAANARNGNYSLRVTPNSTNLEVFAGSYYEVKPDETLYLSGYVKNTAIANGAAGIQINWYNKDKTYLSSSTDYVGLPGTSYILKEVNGTAPAGAAYARVSATVRSTANAGLFYFDDFYMKRSIETGDVTFRNTSNGSSAFRIQSAGASNTLFTGDTSNNIVKIGDNTGTDADTTVLVLDSATANPTSSLASKNGGLFYRSDTNTLKAVIGGAVVDICTTAVTCSGYSASAGSTIQLQASSPGTQQTGNFNISGTGILTQLQTMDSSTASATTSNLVIRTGNSTGAGGNSGNLTLDVGTANGTAGTISIGRAGVATTVGGTMTIQGASALLPTVALGQSNLFDGSILFRTSQGANTVTLRAPNINPTSSWTLTLPQNKGISGDCLKDSDGAGTLIFGNCAAGITVALQDAYNNSGAPATINLANAKDFVINAQDTSTDSNILFNLQCTNSCGSNGKFAVQSGGNDVLRITPAGAINLLSATQIGSSTTDSTQVNFTLDSSNLTTDSGLCSTSVNQGAMYYNTSMGSLRACINGAWGDVSNPDTLGLLTFGIVPSSGANPYDLPSLVVPGVSGPCKVSWASATSVSVEACVAYSGGRRVNVAPITLNTNSATANNINLTTTARWGHICLTGPNNQPAFTTTTGNTAATGGMPSFDAAEPTLCLASVQGESVTAGRIDNIYDTRTFTSSMKEAVTTATAVELGMLTDASGTTGALSPSASGSSKMYGLVVATDGSTSTTTPNTIVNTVGPGWVKATAGTAGQFIRASTTAGYGDTVTAIPNNSFYYSAGNTRTTYTTTCTAANNCGGSLYVNFIVR